MVVFGPVPMVPAHSQKGNPLAIGRDSKDEVVRRGPNPPVPRAPRAAPKAQSAGALARDLWSRRPSSGNLSNVSRTSEQRRPREESPFSQISAQQQHRRVACLSREKEMAENQAFEMGPRKRPSSRTDYSRGHILGKEIEANNGIPFGPEKSQDDGQAPRPAARRHTLRHEQQAAEQALEWVPERHPGGQRTDHARVSTLKREEVAIVDTNNPDELPINISKMKIHSIVDHHKLNGLSNAEPLELDFRPLCSVGSILYARAKALGLTPTKQIAGLMLSGILSDSLGFRSPTTTDIDKIYATELGELAELDVHDHAENMLEAKAQLDDYSVEELVMMDTKIFRLGGKMMRVSVIETTKPLDLLAKKAALVEAQSDIAKKVKLLPGPSGCVQPDARACRRMFLSSIRKGSGTFSSSSSTS